MFFFILCFTAISLRIKGTHASESTEHVSEWSKFISKLDISELTEHVSESTQYVSKLDISEMTH